MNSQDTLLWVFIVIAVVALLWAVINAIYSSKNMLDLGLIIVIIGLFCGWPFMACGVVLVIAHHYKEKR